MKGWYGNKYGHSLASKGVKTKYKTHGHQIKFNTIKQAVLDAMHSLSEFYEKDGSEIMSEMYSEAFYEVMESEHTMDIYRILVRKGIASNNEEASYFIFNAITEEE